MGMWSAAISRIKSNPSFPSRISYMVRWFSSNTVIPSSQRIGFIGLGNMGSHMANNLVEAGYQVTVHDINASAMVNFSNRGVPVKETPSEVANSSDIVITMLPSSMNRAPVSNSSFYAIGSNTNRNPSLSLHCRRKRARDRIPERATSAMDGNSDSDGAPEELTFEQGTKKDEEMKELQRKNKARIAREKKERRRLWAQRKTPKEPHIEAVPEPVDGDDDHTGGIPGMLPPDVVNFLASREKQVFPSDSEPEKETVEHEPISKKRKPQKSWTNTVLLKDLPPPQCALNSLEFLKKRKGQVPRSRAVLTNADQALRLLTSRGSLLSKN